MLEIYTIVERSTEHFDNHVNEALCSGWTLTRREVFIGPDYQPIFYAELERYIDEPEEVEEELDPDTAEWVLSRSPRTPYRCSNCGYSANEQWRTCPGCGRNMRGIDL